MLCRHPPTGPACVKSSQIISSYTCTDTSCMVAYGSSQNYVVYMQEIEAGAMFHRGMARASQFYLWIQVANISGGILVPVLRMLANKVCAYACSHPQSACGLSIAESRTVALQMQITNSIIIAY